MWRFDDPLPFTRFLFFSPYALTYSIQGMKGHDIMQMLEHNQRLECPDKCPQPIYELMLRCWSWRCVYALSLCMHCRIVVYEYTVSVLIHNMKTLGHCLLS